MELKLRASAQRADGNSTWSEIWLTQDGRWITISFDTLDSTVQPGGASMRAAEARVLGAALLEAADLADPLIGDFPP